jgi:putative aldouronate transport system permease protein
MASLSSAKSLGTSRLLLFPIDFTLSNLKYVASTPDFVRIYGNTLFVVGVGTLLSITCTILFAYPIARKIPKTKWLRYFTFFTLLFGGGMIPTYLVVKETGLLNSTWALILPRLMDPFYVFLMINFILGIPESIDEAATIDGASPIRILMQLIIPLSTAGIATLALFYGVSYWNLFFDAILYISNREKWTIQVLLREILMSSQMDILGTGISSAVDDPSMTTGYTIKMATVTLAVIPVMIIYPFVQKYFTKGVLVGAVKA